MKKNIRFFVYLVILLFVLVCFSRVNTCIGADCKNKMIEIGSILNLIPVIEIVYTFYNVKEKKKKRIRIAIMILFIGITVLLSNIYGEHLKSKSKCHCSVAQCTDTLHKDCYVIGEDGKKICDIDCSEYLNID